MSQAKNACTTRRGLFGGLAIVAGAAALPTAAAPVSDLERRIDRALADIPVLDAKGSGMTDEQWEKLYAEGSKAAHDILALDGDDLGTQRLRLKALRWCHSDSGECDFGECTNQQLAAKILTSAIKTGAI